MVDYRSDKEKMMSDWWQSPLGQCVLLQEKALLQTLNSHFYGYCQLQLGVEQRQFPKVTHSAQQKVMAQNADIDGDINALPFKSYSLDTVLLSHALEFSSDPHQALREVERVLVADGSVVLCCFNPWSLWGLRRLLSWQDAPPWHGHFFSQARIRDWLALLNFEVLAVERLMFRPPLSSERWLARIAPMERWGKRLWPVLSGCTILVATKRSIPLTPITKRWQAKQLFPSGSFVKKPVTREKINE
ncbi:MAG: class I SAM-dependent methyltransferase [Methylophagaceae bacterium]